MENLPQIETILSTAQNWLGRVLAVELPVPDAALLLAFVLGVYAIRLNYRNVGDRTRSEVAALYQEELLQANRRAQHARDDLRKAKLEMERERQRRRRETGFSDTAQRFRKAKAAEHGARRSPLVLANSETKLEQTS